MGNDSVFDIMNFAKDGFYNSKDGIETYEDDSSADHGDGQQVGRETAYKAVMCKCAKIILMEFDTKIHNFEE